MSRLASFKGPSTPSSSPVRAPGSALASPSRSSESIYHRKTRALLNDFRGTAFNWDRLLSDGHRTMQNLIDSRTELENELTVIKTKLPPAGLVTPRIQKMEKCLQDLNNISHSLQKTFEKMSATVDNMEQLLYDACRSKGSQWAEDEPLWTTWSLNHIVQHVACIVRTYHQANFALQRLIFEIHPHKTTFSMSRRLLTEWISQLHSTRQIWDDWDDMYKVEIELGGSQQVRS